MPVNLYLQECAAHEERQLLQKVAEMLASSSARKKKLVCVSFGKLLCYHLILLLESLSCFVAYYGNFL